jgi:hypothetical protein
VSSTRTSVVVGCPAGWANTFAGSPPGELIGGFGALDGGLRGWIDLGGNLAPGDYAFVCLLPGPEGTAHSVSGMVSGFTLD